MVDGSKMGGSNDARNVLWVWVGLVAGACVVECEGGREEKRGGKTRRDSL
jgi:hypothetical protein